MSVMARHITPCTNIDEAFSVGDGVQAPLFENLSHVSLLKQALSPRGLRRESVRFT
jgi:hypothetical protein